MSDLCAIIPDDPSCMVPEPDDPEHEWWWWLKKQTPSQGSGPNVADFSVVDAVENEAGKAIQEGM
jgi:hypothetical protein